MTEYEPQNPSLLPNEVFSPDDFLSLFLGEEYASFSASQIVRNQEKNVIWIYLEPKEDPAVEPGTEIRAKHSNGWVSFKQEVTPIQGFTTYVVIRQKRWIVPDTDLHHPRTFITHFDGVCYGKGLSLSLTDEIFSISLLMSAAGTEKICQALGIKVSDQYIRNLYREIEIEDDPHVKFVGIDDVSFKKGVHYRTIVYRGDNHHPMALLDGRDGTELEDWLKKHPEIEVVARDRAGAYAKAVRNALPGAVQVADKFHLFQNLMGYLKKMLQYHVPSKLYVQNGTLLAKVPKYVEVPAVPLDNPTFKDVKLYPVEAQDGKKPDYKQRVAKGKAYMESQRRHEEKYQRVLEIRKQWNEGKDSGMTKLDLEKEYGVSRVTLNKYLEYSDAQVEELRTIKEMPRKPTDADEYLDTIYDMLRQGYRPGYIYSYILYKGYKGPKTRLRNLITAIGLNNFGVSAGRFEYSREVLPPDIIQISRMDILKWITISQKEKMKDSPAAQNFHLILDKYPVVEEIQNIWNDFHEALMNKEKDTGKLDKFLDRYEDSPVSPLIRSIKKDIEPVKAAISSGITSGFVEGSNNRHKLTQKVMFGKSGLDMLFRKNYAISSLYHLGERPKDILHRSRKCRNTTTKVQGKE